MTDVDELYGRELDARVAEEVMGYEVRQPPLSKHERNGCKQYVVNDWGCIRNNYLIQLPHYSSEPMDADTWSVWEELPEPRRMQESYGTVTVLAGGKAYGPSSDQTIDPDTGQMPVKASADTAPEAICRAALKAVRGNV